MVRTRTGTMYKQPLPGFLLLPRIKIDTEHYKSISQQNKNDGAVQKNTTSCANLFIRAGAQSLDSKFNNKWHKRRGFVLTGLEVR